MKDYRVVALNASTWDKFAELVERNSGIYGGCWCISYHPECGQKGINYRAAKEERVRSGRAHHALVLDEDGMAQGWCQWGDAEELSNLKHRREYDKDPPRFRTGASPVSLLIESIVASESLAQRWKEL